ncbi:MAG: Rdx family protein [Acidimicrobiales bacterium]|nr:Rdx family protein [Acidimicrobiales bacterium]MBO0886223.1 Rdx family protein [Acidimicrobiales bacterium]
MTDALLSRWPHNISRLELVPSSGGRFEVTIDGQLIFSKLELKRHAEPGEVEQLAEARLG